MSKGEKRGFSRVPYRSNAILRCSETVLSGAIINLSMNGALIKVPRKIEIGRDVELELFLTGGASDVGFVLNGAVVRHVPDGIAIRFTGMYLDVYERLKEVVGKGLGDRAKVVEEFILYMGREPDPPRRI